MKVKWSKPDIGLEERTAAADSLQKHIGANGPNIELLEKEICEKFNCKYAIAVNNGTSALLVSLLCMKELLGDDVKIGVPNFTFIASANSSRQVFKNVHLLDCCPTTWNIKKDLINESFDVIMPVDVGGLPCDYDELRVLGAKLIGDSAESAGSKYKGAYIGSQADMHCFSLHRAKIITSGEGGIITTNHRELMEMARSYVSHGYSKDKKSHEYKHDRFGLNFRMTDVEASIARVQLKKLDQYVEHRNFIANIYRQELANYLKFQEFDNHLESNYFFFGGLVSDGYDRDRLISDLAERDIETKSWTACSEQPIWRQHQGLRNSKKISDRVILLPIHNTITEQEVEYTIQNLKDCLCH